MRRPFGASKASNVFPGISTTTHMYTTGRMIRWGRRRSFSLTPGDLGALDRQKVKANAQLQNARALKTSKQSLGKGYIYSSKAFKKISAQLLSENKDKQAKPWVAADDRGQMLNS